MSIACISNKIRHIAMAVGPDPLESSIAEIIKQKKESIIKQAEIAIDRLIKTKKVHYSDRYDRCKKGRTIRIFRVQAAG